MARGAAMPQPAGTGSRRARFTPGYLAAIGNGRGESAKSEQRGMRGCDRTEARSGYSQCVQVGKPKAARSHWP